MGPARYGDAKMNTAGRWLAVDHGAFSAEQQSSCPKKSDNCPGPPKDPMVERLSLRSLQALCKMFGWTMSQMQERYGAR